LIEISARRDAVNVYATVVAPLSAGTSLVRHTGQGRAGGDCRCRHGDASTTSDVGTGSVFVRLMVTGVVLIHDDDRAGILHGPP